MSIWYEETNKLKNKIMEERGQYLLQFGEDPNYVVIPFSYIALLETDNRNLITPKLDTYYGMQIIESKNCKSIEDIKVY